MPSTLAPPPLVGWTGPPQVDPDSRYFNTLQVTRAIFDLFRGPLDLPAWDSPDPAAFAVDDRVVSAQLERPWLSLEGLARATAVSADRAQAIRDRYYLRRPRQLASSRLYPAVDGLSKAFASVTPPRTLEDAVDQLARDGIHATAHTAKRALSVLLSRWYKDVERMALDYETASAVRLVHYRHPEWTPLEISARALERGVPVFPGTVHAIVKSPVFGGPERTLQNYANRGDETSDEPRPPAALILDSGYRGHDLDVAFTIKHRVDPAMQVTMLGAAPIKWDSRNGAVLRPPFFDASLPLSTDIDNEIFVSASQFEPVAVKSIADALRGKSRQNIVLVSPFQAFAEPQAAALREELGLRGAPLRTIIASDDKDTWLRDVVKEAGLQTWEQYACHSLDTETLYARVFEVAVKTGNRYVVLKPQHGAANFALEIIDTWASPAEIAAKIAEHQRMMFSLCTPADPMITLVCEHLGDAEAGWHKIGPLSVVTMKDMFGPAIVGHSLDPREPRRALLEELLSEDHRRIRSVLGIDESVDLGDNADVRFMSGDPRTRWWIDLQERVGLMAPAYLAAAFGRDLDGRLPDLHALLLRMHLGEDVRDQLTALKRQGPVAAMVYRKRLFSNMRARRSVTNDQVYDDLTALYQRLGPVIHPAGVAMPRLFWYEWPGGIKSGERVATLDNSRYVGSGDKKHPGARPPYAKAPTVGAVGEDIEAAERAWKIATDRLSELAGLASDSDSRSPVLA